MCVSGGGARGLIEHNVGCGMVEDEGVKIEMTPTQQYGTRISNIGLIQQKI